MVHSVILGCGLAGLTISIAMKSRYPQMDVTIIEKSEYKQRGGLLCSENDRGFIFDTGGSHVIFSNKEDILHFMLSILDNKVITHERKAFILLDDLFVPYPFENGLHVLPPELRAEAFISFMEAQLSRPNDWSPKNFEEWIYGSFGKWIAEKYLIPYNEKIWKRPLSQIDVSWTFTPGRLPIPDWRGIAKAAVGIPTIGYKVQSTFYYPLKGGIQTLYDSLLAKAENLKVGIIWGEKIKEVRRLEEGFIINGKYKADILINTIPLPQLVEALNAPEHVVKNVERLDYNSIVVVGIALKKSAPQQHWVYVPDKNVIFHRYAWISNYSHFNAPKGFSSIIAEITIPKGHQPKIEENVEKVLEDFERIGTFKRQDVIFTRTWFHKYGYPIYTLDHKRVRENVLSWLTEQNIASTGRWGSWHYWNMDKVIEEAFLLIEQQNYKNYLT
ncbi:MAG: FAD-dependent oxidoreductase [Candidatus Verstraetearchaeota archaeon]|jgi:protoporphyrinogen oxidase|nr:FAD-dependent oxidoreductase [Candidatus Verstraetearchaeota archaeon]